MSAKPYLYHCRVAAGEVAAAVDALRDKLRYLYCESEAAIDLVAYRSPDPRLLHGRAFGPELEVRWERADDACELLLLAETPQTLPDGWEALSPDSATLPYPDSADGDSQVLLWGTHTHHLQQPHRLAGGQGDAWIETRIPRALHYPVDGAPPHVVARTIVYRCQGRPVLTRLAGLEGGQDAPQSL